MSHQQYRRLCSTILATACQNEVQALEATAWFPDLGAARRCGFLVDFLQMGMDSKPRCSVVWAKSRTCRCKGVSDVLGDVITILYAKSSKSGWRRLRLIMTWSSGGTTPCVDMLTVKGCVHNLEQRRAMHRAHCLNPRSILTACASRQYCARAAL